MPSRYTIKNRYRDKLRKIEEELGIINTCSNKIVEIIAKIIENLDNNVGSVTYTHHLEESQTLVRKLNIYRNKIINRTAILEHKRGELFTIYNDLTYKRIAMKSASPSKTKKKEEQHSA